MEERKSKVKATIDLYPWDGHCWNMLDPRVMEVKTIEGDHMAIIKFEGKEYIIDRSILKGIL